MENNFDNLSEENFLPGVGRKNSFALPEGYFDTFSERLNKRIEFEEELDEYKILAALNRQLKFSIPENYFENLANILEYKYEQSAYTAITAIPKLNLTSPSADYFETLDKKFMEKLELSSELEEFEVLSSLEKKNNFTVNAAYFENNEQTTKKKHEQPKRSSGGIIKQLSAAILQPQYAIAASMALIIGLASLWYINKTDSTILPGDCKTLACLEKYELLNDKNINDFDEENLYEMVDVDELDKNVSGEATNSDSIKKEMKK